MRDPILNKLRRRRQRAQNARKRAQKKANVAKRLAAKLRLRIERVRIRRKPSKLDETVALDGTPIFRLLRLALLDARDNGWRGVLNSADRREGVAERFGKFSQAKLYACSLNCRADCYGNCNPANPPTQGTHLLIGDGVVGSVGSKLHKWQLGLDTSDADQLRAVLNALGYKVTRPYADSREQHHSNFTKSPRDRLIARGKL